MDRRIRPVLGRYGDPGSIARGTAAEISGGPGRHGVQLDAVAVDVDTSNPDACGKAEEKVDRDGTPPFVELHVCGDENRLRPGNQPRTQGQPQVAGGISRIPVPRG